MPFSDEQLNRTRPASIRSVELPRRATVPSLAGRLARRGHLLPAARSVQRRPRGTAPAARSRQSRCRIGPAGFRWDRWAESGGERWQGGTIAGRRVEARLSAPARASARSGSARSSSSARTDDTYHGYAIQDFLEVDPRFGTRADLVELVAPRTARGLRVILDVIFNHTGNNWVYAGRRRTSRRSCRGRSSIGAGGGALALAGWPPPSPATTTASGRRAAAGGLLHAGRRGQPRRRQPRRPARRVPAHRLRRPAGRQLRRHARARRPGALLQVLDRADRLRRLPPRHAQARGRGDRPQLLRRDQGVRRQPRQGRLLPGRRGGRRGRRRRTLPRGARHESQCHARHRRRRAVAARRRQGPGRPGAVLRVREDAGTTTSGRTANAGTRSTSRSSTTTITCRATRSASRATRRAITRWSPASPFSCSALGIPCIYYGTEQAFAGPGEIGARSVPARLQRREPAAGQVSARGDVRARASASAAARRASARARPRSTRRCPGFGPFGTVGAHCFDPGAAAFVRIAALIARAQPLSRAALRPHVPAADLALRSAVRRCRRRRADRLVAHSRRRRSALHRQRPRTQRARRRRAGRCGAQRSGRAWARPSGLPAISFVVIAQLRPGRAREPRRPGPFTGPHPVGSGCRCRSATARRLCRSATVAPSETLVLINRP